MLLKKTVYLAIVVGLHSYCYGMGGLVRRAGNALAQRFINSYRRNGTTYSEFLQQRFSFGKLSPEETKEFARLTQEIGSIEKDQSKIVSSLVKEQDRLASAIKVWDKKKGFFERLFGTESHWSGHRRTQASRTIHHAMEQLEMLEKSRNLATDAWLKRRRNLDVLIEKLSNMGR